MRNRQKNAFSVVQPARALSCADIFQWGWSLEPIQGVTDRHCIKTHANTHRQTLRFCQGAWILLMLGRIHEKGNVRNLRLDDTVKPTSHW